MILLIRHCQSSGQTPEAPLTELGRRQAERLAEMLAPLGVGSIVSSPYARAVQTIEPFARCSGLAIRRDERLRERELSPDSVPDWLDHVERSYGDLDYALPGGESGGTARRRGREVVDGLIDAPRGPCVVVTHGNLLSLVLGSLDASIAAAGFEFWRSITNPDVYRVSRDHEAWSIERLWREAKV